MGLIYYKDPDFDVTIDVYTVGGEEGCEDCCRHYSRRRSRNPFVPTHKAPCQARCEYTILHLTNEFYSICSQMEYILVIMKV